MIIRTKGYARIGFMGNPSDGYYGKTISSTITNFHAEVTLWESPTLQIIPNPVHDPTKFSSLGVLEETVTRYGYDDGVRLILASCRKFHEYCQTHDIELAEKNFTASYDTTIPRQVGLGGSSAIITAMVKALMEFYEVTHDDIPKPMLPDLILRVETEELEIRAGLQDRVVQVYGGTVYMDFSKEFLQAQGHGHYEYLDSSLIPPLFLAYVAEPSHSGKIHSDVKFRYEQNDPEVVKAMQTFAEYATACREAFDRGDYKEIGALMNKNFDLRRKIYGDEVIGKRNLEMIALARQHECPAKFSGSGGAIIGMYHDWEQLRLLAKIYREHGFSFTKLSIDPGY